MTLFLFLVWLQMSAQPQIKIGEIRPMHHRCQVWMGSGWITLQAEMGALLCEEKDGELVVIGSPDEVQATSGVLGWTSAENPDDTPPGQCGHHADGSVTDCCGALMKSGLNQEFAEAAQRAADETDGKPPKGPLTTKHNHIEVGEFAEPVDVPAVQVDYVARPKGEYYTCGLNLCMAGKDIIAQRPGCEDKSRILEHDENSPPKYWCRKVQP